MNFHLLFVCWRSIALLLRVSKAWGKKRFLVCTFDWVTSFCGPLQICFGFAFQEGASTPTQKLAKGSNPNWVPAGGESGVHTSNSHKEELFCFKEHGGENVAHESSCQGTQGETIKWQRTVLNERKLQLRLLTEIRTNWKSSTRGSGVKGDTAWAWMYFCPWMCKGRKQTTAAAQKLFGTQMAMDTLQYITDTQSKTN